MTRFRLITAIIRQVPMFLFLAVVDHPVAEASSGEQLVDFIAANKELEQADKKLRDKLTEGAGIQFGSTSSEEDYDAAIRAVLDRDKAGKRYIARLTPYACVVAEMLGAKFEILATYRSKADSKKCTYKSYLVVNRVSLDTKTGLRSILEPLKPPGPKPTPTPNSAAPLGGTGVAQPEPSPPGEGPGEPETESQGDQYDPNTPVFIFHDRFSTSSYFLPSLYFRDQRAFVQAVGGTAIRAEQKGKKAFELVQKVAAGEGDLAAIWGDTRLKVLEADKKLEPNHKLADKVHFLPLPQAIPNDLLVCSSNLGSTMEAKLREVIKGTKDNKLSYINSGDVWYWEDIRAGADVLDAREALASLRKAAREQPSKITVEIKSGATDGSNSASLQMAIEAATQAVRLAGTEFEIFDRDFHKTCVVEWTLTFTHDGTLLLTSDILNSDVPAQTFPISYSGEEDLTKRIGALIHSRMHRIRYIWPYEQHNPTIIRDIDYAVAKGTILKAQKVTWQDMEKSGFSTTPAFSTTVQEADFYKIVLRGAEFSQSSSSFSNPLSNVGYRVVLERPSTERLIFKVFTWLFVAAFAAGGAVAVFDLRRGNQPVPARQTEPIRLSRICQNLVAKSHERWRRAEITENNILACDRPRVDAFIVKLRTEGQWTSFDEETESTTEGGWNLRFPFFKNIGSLNFGSSRKKTMTTKPWEVDDATRVSKLLKFLLQNDGLSPFIGKPIEWQALNLAARETLFDTDGGSSESNGELIQAGNPLVLDVAARHFASVVDEGLRKPSLFCVTGKVEKTERECFFRTKESFPQSITLTGASQKISAMIIDVDLTQANRVPEMLDEEKPEMWIFGTIRLKQFPLQNGTCLRLLFAPLAILTS